MLFITDNSLLIESITDVDLNKVITVKRKSQVHEIKT